MVTIACQLVHLTAAWKLHSHRHTRPVYKLPERYIKSFPAQLIFRKAYSFSSTSRKMKEHIRTITFKQSAFRRRFSMTFLMREFKQRDFDRRSDHISKRLTGHKHRHIRSVYRSRPYRTRHSIDRHIPDISHQVPVQLRKIVHMLKQRLLLPQSPLAVLYRQKPAPVRHNDPVLDRSQRSSVITCIDSYNHDKTHH